MPTGDLGISQGYWFELEYLNGHYQEALEAAVDLLERKGEENPSDIRPYSDLWPILAALGRRESAITAARRAVELMPGSKDAEAGVPSANNLALTYALLGAAIRYVEGA